MSNKITLATIQFRADTKGVNPALDAMRQSSKDAHDEVDRLQEALDKGIKKMKDANGVEFDVTDKFRQAQKAAKSYDQALRELVKGATALETVVKNIRLGEIEKSSRAELKGAINAAEARKRSVRESDPEDLAQQRDLNKVIEESRKQLNNLDRDTQKVIETLDKGGVIAQATLDKEIKGLKEILTLIPKGTDEWNKYNQQLTQMETHVANIRRQEREAAVSVLGSKDFGRYSEEEIRTAITNARELLATYKTASPEAKALADNIVRADQYLKEHGIEAARQAAREKEQLQLEQELAKTMNKRLRDLKDLSADALVETHKYWEAQKNGAAEGTTEFNKAEAALKKIDGYQRNARRTELGNILGDPSKFGVSEVKAAVQEAEKLRDSVQKGIPVWFQYNKMVEQGREYLDRLAKSEAADHISQQMNNLSSLSASGLQEVKKYWETMVAGAEKGSSELRDYEQHLEHVKQEERERNEISNNMKAQRLGGNLSDYSEAEIREAIEAAKQLVQTYKTADPAAQHLAERIAVAEQHLKHYGVEAARTVQMQRENINMMANQWNAGLNNGGLSESVMKSHERFWQQLIDDPKTAAENLDLYRQNLAAVQREIKRRADDKIQTEGRAAFDFFQQGMDTDASAAEVKKQADALKLWRDSLPQQSEADTILKINGYLQKAGLSAQKTAEQTMKLRDALRIGGDVRSGNFRGTVEQLKEAKKVLEQTQQQAVKGGLAWRRMQDGIESINIELKRTEYISAEVQAVLDQPKGRSFNALKQAVEQGRAALQAMDRTTKEGQREFDELAKKVKAADQEMKDLANSSKGAASAFEKAWSRVRTYLSVYVGTAVAMQKVTATMGDLMDLSDRMGEVRKTTGFTADEVGRLSENLKKMDVRTSLTSLMEISASAGQLGLKTLEDVQGFTEAANKLMIALPEMGREAATEMMRVAIATGEVDKIRKQLQEGTIEGSSATAVAMEKIASTIDRLRASSASTAPEITDFVKRVGAVGAQSGITIDQVAALGSTVSSLGMRIEMSATALSRMIPAIRNNAFELAKAIGVTPDTIRNLFDTGRGMEVILMILQRIKDTGMDADSVEQMLGMAGMRDIMKDLNQQGARAGIVFSGLSQNVDELRRQLGVAGEAYEENIAIQQEFDKMNETTAAKWERLKNALEEAFVSDKAQRFLGTVIDGLRKIVDLLMGGGGLTTALATISTLVLVLKTNIIGIMWSAIALGLTKIIDLFKNWRIALDLVILKLRALTLAQWANVFVAAASAVAMLVYSLRNAANAMSETSKAMGEVEKQLHKQMTAADKLFRSLAKVREQERVAALAAKEQAKAETEKGKAVEQSADKTDKLSKETDKLAGSEKKAAEQTAKVEEGMKRVNAEGKESARIIREINSKYGAYLGYMLSETASAKQLAEARELINKKLRETITLKQKEAALSDIEQEYGGKVRKGASSTDDLIASYFGSNDEAYARVSVAVSEAAQKYAKDQKKFQAEVQKIVMANRQFISQSAKKDFRDAYAQSGRGASDNEIVSSIASNIGARAESYRESVAEYQKQVETAERVFDARTNVLRKESRESAVRTLNSIMADWKDALARYQKAEGEEKEKLAVEVYKQQRSYNNLFANNADYFTNDKRKGTIERSIENMKSYEKGLRQVADESIRAVDAAERAESKIQNTDFTNGNEGSGNSPWGTSERADSTTYTEMTAEQLVNRREQMNKFVNSLQTDTDVKAVLNEDKALKKAIEAGMASDMRTVIEWYNTERLKIQDELHARHLTNTGDWLDPKKERGAKKQFRDEMDAYLHELDAYYTERKTVIEQARNDEEITEGEAWRRTIQNDNEWQTRRAELQKLYSRKQKEVTQEELDAIIRIIAERTGDSESFVKAAIAKTNQFVDAIEKSGDKGAAIVHRWMSQVVLDTERSYLKAAQAIGKQMKFIEDTLAKERPYDGITKNLQDNLDKMGVLAAKFRRENEELARQGKEPKYSNEQITAQSYDKMAFYLRQAADAYSIDIDELLRRMVKEGMTATAEEISKSDMLKQAVMGQLRKTYQEVQDAIKKEASQIKKDVEIIWNDDARGIGGMSMKATFDKALAQLGMQQDSVSRANSLIGAGAASDNVALRLAMKQIEVQMRMQKAQYDMYRVQANQRMAALKAEAEEHRRLAKLAEKEKDIREASRQNTLAENALLDARNVKLSLGLTLAEETKKQEQQKAELLKIQEESQNRLYTSLREWADLLTSSLQGVFEASHAGDAEYYNEMAKLNLTGKGGPGAGTYVVIDDAGTSDATAHYEYLDERQALERQHEIEVQNAQAEAWRKLWDDLNMKMSEQITDWMNAYLQNKATEDNTAELQRLQQKLQDEQQKLDASVTATDANTQAVQGLTQKFSEGITIKQDGTQPDATGNSDFAADKQAGYPSAPAEAPSNVDFASDKQAGYPGAQTDPANTAATDANTQAVRGLTQIIAQQGGFGADKAAGYPSGDMPSVDGGSFDTTDFAASKQAGYPSGGGELSPAAQQQINEQNAVTENFISNKQKEVKTEKDTGNQMAKSNASTFAKMTMAANLYGIAYQAMSNDNLSATQKFEMIALQSVGNFAISSLTAFMSKAVAEGVVNEATVLGKLWSQLGWAAAPVFAIFTGLLGAAMGAATSAVSKSKSQIAQATGSSVGAGRLATGMLTYAEGNVNELTDPASLTPGRQYNVDGTDGKTYRARYMGKGAKTHITNGPEFHLVGEAGREAIIDAKTTRLLQMNETGIWRDIQTLYNGGSISGLSTRRRRGGVRAFAEGNIGEFEEMSDGGGLMADGGADMGFDPAALQASLDRNSEVQELLLERLQHPLTVAGTGPNGVVAMYDKLKKEAQRHGEKYI